MKHTCDEMLVPYRVQIRRGFWRRKWQVEWYGCHFAPRGYTRSGCLRRANRWLSGKGKFDYAVQRTAWLVASFWENAIRARK